MLEEQFYIQVFKDGEHVADQPSTGKYPSVDDIVLAILDHNGDAAKVHKLFVLL